MNTFSVCLAFLCICSTISAIPPRLITDQTELDNLKETIIDHMKKVTTENGGYTDLNLIRIHSATEKVVNGRFYELFAEINENNTPVNCTVSLWDKPWIEEFVVFGMECGEEERKYFYSSGFDRVRRQAGFVGFGGFGGFSAMTKEQLDNLHPKLSTTFNHLKANKAGFGFNLNRIISGKSQVVAGSHYIVQVEATNKDNVLKQCEADILENLKGEFHQVDVKCENETFQYTKQ